jgi:hypothetical protein
MVRRTYIGVRDPLGRFDAMKPFVAELRAMQRECKPFGRDYHAIAVAIEGLETAAYHFTRRPHFYGSQGV